MTSPSLLLSMFMLGWAAGLGTAFHLLHGSSSRKGTFSEDWRRRFNHENRSVPSGPPPLRLKRSTRHPDPWGPR